MSRRDEIDPSQFIQFRHTPPDPRIHALRIAAKALRLYADLEVGGNGPAGRALHIVLQALGQRKR